VTAPLAGVTVVVTRPRAQSSRFAALVAEAGGRPLLIPALEIAPIDLDPASRARLTPDMYDWTIYTSANAVLHSMRQLTRPTRSRIAAIGRATARALQEQHVEVDAVPPAASESEGLLALDAFAEPSGLRILIVKGEGGRRLLQEEFARRGAEVETAEVYRRVRAQPDEAILDELGQAFGTGRVVVAATSVETLDSLLATVPESRIPGLREATLLVPGERVAAAAHDRRWSGPVIVAASAEDSTMAMALVDAAGPTGVVTSGAC
jgi:uroporphyrinogen-III synthase